MSEVFQGPVGQPEPRYGAGGKSVNSTEKEATDKMVKEGQGGLQSGGSALEKGPNGFKIKFDSNERTPVQHQQSTEEESWTSLFQVPKTIQSSAKLYEEAEKAGRRHPISKVLAPSGDKVDPKIDRDHNNTISANEISTASIHGRMTEIRVPSFPASDGLPDIVIRTLERIVLEKLDADTMATVLRAGEGQSDAETIRRLNPDMVNELEPAGMSINDLKVLDKYAYVEGGLSLLIKHFERLVKPESGHEMGSQDYHETPASIEDKQIEELAKSVNPDENSNVRDARIEIIKALRHMQAVDPKQTNWTLQQIKDHIKKLPKVPDPRKYTE